MLIMKVEFNVIGRRKLFLSGVYGDVGMGKFVKEISVLEIFDEELRRIIGVDNIDNGLFVCYVFELFEEKVLI